MLASNEGFEAVTSRLCLSVQRKRTLIPAVYEHPFIRAALILFACTPKR
jgi:hypothetical protein